MAAGLHARLHSMCALNKSTGADAQEEAKLEAWEVDMIAKIERVEARFADLDGRIRADVAFAGEVLVSPCWL